jgi:hypothetical protein
MDARYHVKSGDYISASGKISEWKDITGKGNDLKQNTSTYQPTLSTTGFGTNSTGYVNFSSNSYLEVQKYISIHYAFFALRTPQEITGSQTFGLITNIHDQSTPDPYDPNAWEEDITYYGTLNLESNSTTGYKALTFSPIAKYKINSDIFNFNYDNTFFSSTLWSFNQNYLMMFEYQFPTTVFGTPNKPKTSIIGAYDDGGAAVSSFRGRISEIIFASGTLSKTQMDLIRDQLNDIHGIY